MVRHISSRDLGYQGLDAYSHHVDGVSFSADDYAPPSWREQNLREVSPDVCPNGSPLDVGTDMEEE